MNYKYSIPIFDEEDEEYAKEVLIEKYIPNESSDLTKLLLRNSYKRMIESLYGVNIVLMANFYQTQKFFYDKIKQPLLNHLFNNDLKASIIATDVSSLSSKSLVYNATNDKNFKPVSYWNPRSKWDEGMFITQHEVSANTINPINTFDHISLEINQFEMSSNFGGLLFSLFDDPYIQFSSSNEKFYIKLLPYATPMHLLKIMDIIYETF